MVRRILRLPAGRIAVGVLLLIALLAVLGPILAPQNPLAANPHTLAAPSWQHWLGTDYLGRDVFSRLLDGSRTSVVGSVEVALVALAVGVLPGILSVYLGLAFEWVALRLTDTLIALPFLVFAVAVTALLGNGIPQAMLTVGVLVSPLFFRVSRAATLVVARSQYVEAALLGGASVGRIVRRHVWAKVLPPIGVALAQTIGVGFVVVSSLTFLGIGVQPPAPTWGGLLASDLNYLDYQPWAPVAPALLIMATVWGCNLLADVLRDVSGEAGRALLNTRTAQANRAGEKVPAPRLRIALPANAANPAPVAHEPGVVLAVRDVRIRDAVRDRDVVSGVSFRLRPGGVVGIVGESGSGKTLTCRAVLGILPEHFRVAGGSVAIAGRDIAQLTPAQWTAIRGSTISAVFQDPGAHLNPSLTVGSQIAEVLRVKTGLSRRKARRRAVELLAAVRLRDPGLVYDQYPFELSGGMQQRVLIAAAIAADPQVLIADEATTALDVTVQAEILDLLADLRERTGLAIVLVSHDLAVVAQFCDEVLVMREGEVVEQGPTGQVLYQPRHEYTRLLVTEHEEYGLDRFLDGESPRRKEFDGVR